MTFDRLRRRKTAPYADEPVLSFGDWSQLPTESVIQVCHPAWRGVRTVTYSFRSPVVECSDLGVWGEGVCSEADAAGVRLVVIQGWPPGARGFAELVHSAGIEVKCLLHSSPAQHGSEPGEAGVADEVLGLARSGVLASVGMVKAGVVEAFEALGHRVVYVPNRAPIVGPTQRIELGSGLNVGVFAEPFWRKNVTTQLLAVGLLEGASAHVMRRPANSYLDRLRVVEHGELPYDEFTSLQGSVDINFYVTLSECHPSTPQESYLAGVPCLISKTSAVFRSDTELWDLTTVDELDNPEAIAVAARRLLGARAEAVERARVWIDEADQAGAAAWAEFTA